MAEYFKEKKLRLMTYLSPGIPVELYQVYQHYLESVLNCQSYLIVESRWSGPPKHRIDPLTEDDVDIVFMCSSIFLRLLHEKNAYMELMEAAPVHFHPKSEMKPVYFSDVIILKSKSEKYKEFIDLKGHRWAYNEEESLSGNLATLMELKRMGTNASFFGHIVHSGSHLNSIQMVLNSTVDAAAIDSCVLRTYLSEHPQAEDKLHVLSSWGPFPIPPVILNSRLPGEVKNKIKTAFLDIEKSSKWRAEIAKYSVWGFKEVSHQDYDKELQIYEMVKDQSLSTVYY